MTGLLLFAAVIGLLVVALEVTHRRRPAAWRPGLDTRNDRDAMRLEEDLLAAAQPDSFPSLGPELTRIPKGREVADAWRHSNRAA